MLSLCIWTFKVCRYKDVCLLGVNPVHTLPSQPCLPQQFDAHHMSPCCVNTANSSPTQTEASISHPLPSLGSKRVIMMITWPNISHLSPQT